LLLQPGFTRGILTSWPGAWMAASLLGKGFGAKASLVRPSGWVTGVKGRWRRKYRL
jgi:hypothetical protein